MLDRCAPPKRSRPTMADRFWRKVDKSGDCWLWTGTKTNNGYGMFCVDGSMRLAHRVAWQLTHGLLPEWSEQRTGLCVLHRCDVRACVNPSHLWLGSNSENMTDMMLKKRHRAKSSPGELNGCCVLSNAEVLAIRNDERISAVIARDYGISGGQVRKIKCRQRWGHL